MSLSDQDPVVIVANGHPGLTISLLIARDTYGMIAFRKFMEAVPQRGQSLWDRFEQYRVGRKDIGFTEFYRGTLPFYATATLEEIAEAHTEESRSVRASIGRAAAMHPDEGTLFPYGCFLGQSLGLHRKLNDFPSNARGQHLNLVREFGGRYKHGIRRLGRTEPLAIRYALCVVDRILEGRDVHESRERGDFERKYQRFGHVQKIFDEYRGRGGIPYIPGNVGALVALDTMDLNPNQFRVFREAYNP
jgi:hypothetical protein